MEILEQIGVCGSCSNLFEVDKLILQEEWGSQIKGICENCVECLSLDDLKEIVGFNMADLNWKERI